MRAGYGVYATDPELFRQLYGVALPSSAARKVARIIVPISGCGRV